MGKFRAMDTLVKGKTDTELLEIVVYALTAEENHLLNRLTNKNVYGENLPDAAIVDAICRHVLDRVGVKVIGAEDNHAGVEQG